MDARLKLLMCMLCIMLYVFFVFVAFIDMLVTQLCNNIVLARYEARRAKILNPRCHTHEIGMGCGFNAFQGVVLHTRMM